MTTVFLLASSALAFSAVDSSGNRSRLLPFLALLVIVAVATLVSASPRYAIYQTYKKIHSSEFSFISIAIRVIHNLGESHTAFQIHPLAHPHLLP